jgi:Ca2+-binding RTX toxin-like protein
VLDGGAGDDRIYGGNGSDTIYTGEGNDTVVAGGGIDDIMAGSGHNKVFAGEGNDWILLGRDTYAEGNEGNDTFRISVDEVNGSTFTAVGGEGHDTFLMQGLGIGPVGLPLAAISLRVESIEEFDASKLSGADMTLKAADILDFTETGILQIDGNKNETLHLDGGSWTDAGDKGNGFHDYVSVSNNQLVTAHVDTEIQVVIA